METKSVDLNFNPVKNGLNLLNPPIMNDRRWSISNLTNTKIDIKKLSNSDSSTKGFISSDLNNLNLQHFQNNVDNEYNFPETNSNENHLRLNSDIEQRYQKSNLIPLNKSINNLNIPRGAKKDQNELHERQSSIPQSLKDIVGMSVRDNPINMENYENQKFQNNPLVQNNYNLNNSSNLKKQRLNYNNFNKRMSSNKNQKDLFNYSPLVDIPYKPSEEFAKMRRMTNFSNLQQNIYNKKLNTISYDDISSWKDQEKYGKIDRLGRCNKNLKYYCQEIERKLRSSEKMNSILSERIKILESSRNADTHNNKSGTIVKKYKNPENLQLLFNKIKMQEEIINELEHHLKIENNMNDNNNETNNVFLKYLEKRNKEYKEELNDLYNIMFISNKEKVNYFENLKSLGKMYDLRTFSGVLAKLKSLVSKEQSFFKNLISKYKSRDSRLKKDIIDLQHKEELLKDFAQNVDTDMRKKLEWETNIAYTVNQLIDIDEDLKRDISSLANFIAGSNMASKEIQEIIDKYFIR